MLSSVGTERTHPAPSALHLSFCPYHRSVKQTKKKMQLNQGAIKGHLARQMCKVTKKNIRRFSAPRCHGRFDHLHDLQSYPVRMNPSTLMDTSHREAKLRLNYRLQLWERRCGQGDNDLMSFVHY